MYETTLNTSSKLCYATFKKGTVDNMGNFADAGTYLCGDLKVMVHTWRASEHEQGISQEDGFFGTAKDWLHYLDRLLQRQRDGFSKYPGRQTSSVFCYELVHVVLACQSVKSTDCKTGIAFWISIRNTANPKRNCKKNSRRVNS